MSVDTSNPPVVNPHRLQFELDSLMAAYERRDHERTQKNFEGCLAMPILGIGLAGLLAAEGRIPFSSGPLIVLFFLAGGLLSRDVIRSWRRRAHNLEELDRQLIALSPLLAHAGRLHLTAEDRNRLHDRLFVCAPETITGIIGVLEVAGSRDSLHYLRSLAGSGFYAHLLAPRVRKEIRSVAAEAARSLKRKLELETHAETLLRSSGAANEKELLRPAAAAETPQEQLLRSDTVGPDIGDEACDETS